MPGWKTHGMIGIGVGILSVIAMFYFKVPTFWFYGLGMVVAVFYALLPDVDHRNSFIHLALTFLGLGAILYFALTKNLDYVILVDLIMVGILIATLITGHRGWFHSWSAALVLSLPLIFFSDTVSLPFIAVTGFVGYCSHIIADKFIKEEAVEQQAAGGAFGTFL